MKYHVPVLAAALAATAAFAPQTASARSGYYFGFNTGPAFYPAPAPVVVAPPPPVFVARPVYAYPAPCYRPFWGSGFSFGYWHR